MSFLQFEPIIPNIQPETLFKVGFLTVTNAMLTGVAVTIVVIIICAVLTSKFRDYKQVPLKFQAFLEFILQFFMEFIDQISGGRETTIKILPVVGTVFIYVLISNILTLMPLFGAFTYDGVPLFRTHTNDFNTTLAIAVGVVLSSHAMSIKKNGVLEHVNKFVAFKTFFNSAKTGPNGIIEGVIAMFVGLLDIVSEVGKSLSLSLRLFGNMFAGEVLMVVFLSLFAFFLPAVWTISGLFSGLIQAVVFAALSASYCAAAIKED